MGGRIGGLWKRIRRYRVVIWFVLGLIVLDRLVATRSRLWDAYDPHPYRELLARCRQQPWDVLVVGGSPTMCGIDPAALVGTPWSGGSLQSAFNFGLPLGTAADVCLAAEHGPSVPPRLLVYGATATDFNGARIARDGARDLMTAGDFGRMVVDRPTTATKLVGPFLGERTARAWQLYYHRRGLRLWLADLADRACPGLCATEAAEARRGLGVTTAVRSGAGYCFHQPVTPAMRLDCLKAAGQVSDWFPFMDRFRVGEAYLDCLDHMLAVAGRRGTPVLIVDLPVPADLDKRLFPEQFAAYRAALQQVAANHGVSVAWATCESVGLTDADFSDLVHLNGNGAARFSRWLRDTIAQARQLNPESAFAAGVDR
jgi:hypothetical protein